MIMLVEKRKILVVRFSLLKNMDKGSNKAYQSYCSKVTFSKIKARMLSINRSKHR